MAYATTYERVAGVSGFTTHSTNNPTTPHVGATLDSEFNTIRSRMNEMLVNSTLIQRSDGALANGVVTQDSLAEEIYAGINTPSVWTTATSYSVRDSVVFSTKFYKCIVAHTSGTFATDLAAAKWSLLFDFATLEDFASGLVKVRSASDTTPADLDTKITVSGGLVKTVQNSGAAETVNLYAPTYPTDLSYGGVKTADFTFAAGTQYIVCCTGAAITARSPASPTQNHRTEFAKVGVNAFTIELAGNSFNGSATNPVSASEGLSTLVFVGCGRGYTEG